MTDPKARIAAIVAAAEPAAPEPPASIPPKKARAHDDGAPPSDGADDGDGVPPEIVAACAAEPQNDTGNGRRLLTHFGPELMHVREIGWHAWTGTHWERSGGDEAAVRYAQRTAQRMRLEIGHLGASEREQEIIAAGEEAAGVPKKERSAEQEKAVARASELIERVGGRRAARWKFAISSGNQSRINGMLGQALPHCTWPPDALDADPLAFNCLNGTLRFVQEPDPECPDPTIVRLKWTVRLDPHAREDRITHLAPVAYDPEAACPQWDANLERFQPAETVRLFLRDYHGYALTGLTGGQNFVYNWGGGANFKSTFIEALSRLFGPYAQTLNPESFTGQQQRRGDQATPDFAELPGARLLRVSELPDGAKLNEALVKAVTGGEPMKVRHLNKGFFTFRPVFKASMSGNSRPEIHDVSHGMWRRVLLVPWTVTIPDEERREFEEMQTLFEAERCGILNWLIAGALSYLDSRRLIPPEEVTAATAELRAEMDPVQRFLDACVRPCAGATIAARELFEAFGAWCSANNVRVFSEKRFAQVVYSKGLRKQEGRIRMYLDIETHGVPERPPGPSPRSPPNDAYLASRPSHSRRND